MARLVADFSMSLDGFVCGPNVGMEQPMGEGGEALHAWMFGDVDPVDARITQQMRANTGAVILGKRTFDVGIAHWQDVPFPVPCFVLTHAALPERRELSGSFRFVGGLEEALRLARAAAGEDTLTLVYSARDTECNQAVALMEYLQRPAAAAPPAPPSAPPRRSRPGAGSATAVRRRPHR